jgi:hypothetical protein
MEKKVLLSTKRKIEMNREKNNNHIISCKYEATEPSILFPINILLNIMSGSLL